MEEVLSTLKSIKKELDEQRIEIRETGKNVTEQELHKTLLAFLRKNFWFWKKKLEN